MILVLLVLILIQILRPGLALIPSFMIMVKQILSKMKSVLVVLSTLKKELENPFLSMMMLGQILSLLVMLLVIVVIIVVPITTMIAEDPLPILMLRSLQF